MSATVKEMQQFSDKKLHNNNKKSMNFCIDFHGAAIITEDGQEVAITEEMVENACNQLMNEKSQ